MYSIKSFLLLVLLTFVVRAEPSLNSVQRIALGEIDLIHGSATFQDVERVFGGMGDFGLVQFNDCTGNYSVAINYPGKFVELEFFGEKNTHLNLDALLSLPPERLMLEPAKASLSISWGDMASFKESLIIGDLTVRGDLSVEAFKRVFPLSADINNGYSLVEGEDISYWVIGQYNNEPNIEPNNVDLAYRLAVKFTFRKGRLSRLAINQGLAC